jgi:hypothetical protein
VATGRRDGNQEIRGSVLVEMYAQRTCPVLSVNSG